MPRDASNIHSYNIHLQKTSSNRREELFSRKTICQETHSKACTNFCIKYLDSIDKTSLYYSIRMTAISSLCACAYAHRKSGSVVTILYLMNRQRADLKGTERVWNGGNIAICCLVLDPSGPHITRRHSRFALPSEHVSPFPNRGILDALHHYITADPTPELLIHAPSPLVFSLKQSFGTVQGRYNERLGIWIAIFLRPAWGFSCAVWGFG